MAPKELAGDSPACGGSSQAPSEHEVRLVLADRVRLNLMLWGEEHRWVFRHRLEVRGEDAFRVELLCDTSLVVDYERGRVQPDLVLSMHVILPGRAGQYVYAGCDISPGYKTYLEWSFRLDPRGTFRLRQLQVGARPPISMEHGPALVKPVELPFPVPADIPAESGRYRVPFRADVAGRLGAFEFPASTVRRLGNPDHG